MDKNVAELIRKGSLEAVQSLSRVLEVAKGACSQNEFESLKKGVGLAIGQIQMEILEPVYRAHPDLDDLRQK